jgi:hypothetical protein
MPREPALRNTCRCPRTSLPQGTLDPSLAHLLALGAAFDNLQTMVLEASHPLCPLRHLTCVLHCERAVARALRRHIHCAMEVLLLLASDDDDLALPSGGGDDGGVGKAEEEAGDDGGRA